MGKISQLFDSKFHHYRQVKRVGDVAVYKLWSLGTEEKSSLPHYEVVLIGKRDGVEVYPSTRDWGKKGWTFMTKAAAGRKFAHICDSMRLK